MNLSCLQDWATTSDLAFRRTIVATTVNSVATTTTVSETRARATYATADEYAAKICKIERERESLRIARFYAQ